MKTMRITRPRALATLALLAAAALAGCGNDDLTCDPVVSACVDACNEDTDCRTVWDGELLHFDGKRWRRDRSDSPHTLHAVWGAARNDVWAGGDVGNFGFKILPAASATPISVNTVVSGSLDPADSLAVFSFDAQAGEQLFLDQLSSSQPYYNAVWQLYGPSGQQVSTYYFGDYSPSVLP